MGGSETDGIPRDSIQRLLPAWRHKHDRAHPDFLSGPSLAKSIDVDPGLINQIENGRTVPSARVLELIAARFEKDPNLIGEYRRAHARQLAASGGYDLVDTGQLDRIETTLADAMAKLTSIESVIAGATAAVSDAADAEIAAQLREARERALADPADTDTAAPPPPPATPAPASPRRAGRPRRAAG